MIIITVVMQGCLVLAESQSVMPCVRDALCNIQNNQSGWDCVGTAAQLQVYTHVPRVSYTNFPKYIIRMAKKLSLQG